MKKKTFAWFAMLAYMGCAGSCCVSAAGAPTSPNAFGFAGRELFPIDNQISLVHAADIDGDGLTDIVVANNERSKINILYNQTGATNQPGLQPMRRPAPKREINELPPDARFRIESIASEKRIAAMVVTDLDSDGRPDIAYYGEPRELVVQYNEGTNGWSAPKRFAIDDGQLTQNALVAGDLNGDGLTDLVLLAEGHLYAIHQKPGGVLDEPQRIPVASIARAVQILDVDGNGKNDLLLVNFDSPTPVRFMLQEEAGQFGPEIYFELPPIRAFCAGTFDPGHRAHIVTIAQNSGRAAIWRFAKTAAPALADGLVQGQFCVLPLARTDKAQRGCAWADLDADGLVDLIVAEPENGQVSIRFQQKNGRLAPPKTFPSLTGVSTIEVADWDADGRPELFMLSTDERQVGVARLDKNLRLPFPTLIPTEGRPLAIAVGQLKPGSKPALVAIIDQDGTRQLLTVSADGARTTQKLSEGFKSNPATLAVHDADQDGLPDVVVLIPYEKVKILRQTASGGFDELDIAPAGGVIEQPWLSTADLDSDGKAELLLAQKNFIRALVLRQEMAGPGGAEKGAWAFQVKEQINGAASNSKLVAAAFIPQPTGTPCLFLLDIERKSLSVARPDRLGVWQIVRNVKLPVWEFQSLRPVAFGGAQLNAIALVGLNAVAWLALEGDVWEMVELDTYETPIKDGRLFDLVLGDLNHDGRNDLVFLETAKNHIDIVEFSPEGKLVPGQRWQVFEERTFRGRRFEMPEPREATVADVTGDGKNDLIIVVHDRVIVYPQE
ncbi:MAG: VCBS repeat-containing protein [Verrucomicrobiae bacterium]|nr:VCBS repeat-containing protein [Verrucomicrobiae bacterium]